jgi:hypothetical protein
MKQLADGPGCTAVALLLFSLEATLGGKSKGHMMLKRIVEYHSVLPKTTLSRNTKSQSKDIQGVISLNILLASNTHLFSCPLAEWHFPVFCSRQDRYLWNLQESTTGTYQPLPWILPSNEQSWDVNK